MKKMKRIFLIFLSALLLFPIRAGAKAQKQVALTFDDGPSGAITSELLQGLRERGIRATFFLCCYRIEENPENVKEMKSGGHELGIHGFSHDYFTHMTEKALEKELDCTAEAITALTGEKPKLLRPPGGLYNEDVLKMAGDKGYPVILWSLDPEDWDPAQRCFTVDRVVQSAKDGDVILLHDLSRENILSALTIADKLLAQGFSFCTVSELAGRSNTELLPGKVYKDFSKTA